MQIERRGAACFLAAALALAAWGTATAEAAVRRDRTPPTNPTNLRVVGLTPYSVTLAWNPSTDNSGQFSYVICCANVSSQRFPGGGSTFTYTAGLEASRPFTLFIQAFDAAGNYSKMSNTVSFTTPPDTIPPTRPLVSLVGKGPTHVALAWSSEDNGPNIWFTVYKNGSPILQGTRSTSGIVPLLQPLTDYTFTVLARDFAGRVSPLSEPLATTTAAADPNDHSPPTTPGNLGANSWGDCEVELDWDESVDDRDDPLFLEYEVYVNGLYDHSTSLRYTRTIVYGSENGDNTFSVIAVDTAGNKSPAAVTTIPLTCFF